MPILIVEAKIAGKKVEPVIIKGTNSFDVAKTYSAQMQKQEKINAQKNSATQVERADVLDISPEARQVQKYLAALKELPDVREELVLSLRKFIQAGTYKPDAGKIAGGILEDELI